jgi:cell division protein FtsL
MMNKGFWASLTSKVFLVTAAAAVAAVGFGIVKSLVKRAEIEREIQALQNEISKNQLQAEKLSQLIEYLNTEEFREKEARLQLGLRKPGESVVVVPNTAEADEASISDLNKTSENLSNWQRWLKYLFAN